MRIYQRAINLIITLILLIGMAGPASLAPPETPALQPALAEIAKADPQARVQVIVMKAGQDNTAERLVARLGGEVRRDLQLINAFSARIEAGLLVVLAADSSVNWVTLDGPVESAGKPAPTRPTFAESFYLDTLGVKQVWKMGYKGSGIGVAVIDSGISPSQDFTTLKRSVSFNQNSNTPMDVFGHGSHVAGIIAGNGTLSGGYYEGVAPNVDLINLKVCDETGMAFESDVVAALQWVYENKAAYNIRVVNLSVNSTVEQSYHASPLNAAVEILWFDGVVVVVSAGNQSESGLNPANSAPANDPFVITVGASDEKLTALRSDDSVTDYSAHGGATIDGFSKPDIIAPGQSIYSVLSKDSDWDVLYPDRCENKCTYFRLSGTSMAAPMVTGAVALLLQKEPKLTPDQVKYRLLNTASAISFSAVDQVMTYPYLDVFAAVTGTTTDSANTGLSASQLLLSVSQPVYWGTVNWGSVNWGSVNWGSVNWGSVNWGSVNWGSVNWGSTYWGD